MSASYQVRVYNTSGDLVSIITDDIDLRTLTIEHTVNGISNLTLGIYARASAVQYLEQLDCIIQVLRRVPEADLDWYTEYVGFHRTPQNQITEANAEIFTSYSRGLLDLVRRRSIRYYADTNGSAKGPAPADDVVKEYVRENAGVDATIANSRLTDGVTAGLTVASNASAAPVYEGANAWRNLLDAIRDIGSAHQVDFDVVWLGGVSFEFRTYYPQLGTDRRASGANPFSFAPELGNMINPSYTRGRTDEVNSVLVLGPGEGPLRDTTLVEQVVWQADSPWNLHELDQDARSEDVEEALLDVGREVLTERRPAVSFACGTIQRADSCYGKHYFLGDIVTGQFSTVSADVKINGVNINVTDHRESITLDFVEEVEPFQ